MKISIHFRLRPTENGIRLIDCPEKKTAIRCHVSIDGEENIPFSTGFRCSLDEWDEKKERILDAETGINLCLNDIENDLILKFAEMKRSNEILNARILINEYKNRDKPIKVPIKAAKSNYLIKINDDFLKLMKSRISAKNIEERISEITYNKWEDARNHLAGFVSYFYKADDIDILEIACRDAEKFVEYMKSLSNNRGGYNSHEHAFRTFRCWWNVMEYAIDEKMIKVNPFDRTKLKRMQKKKKKIYLLPHELKLLWEATELSNIEAGIRDAFLVMCMTGFTYGDYKEFAADPRKYIFEDNDGYRYIEKNRFKKRADEDAIIPYIPYLPEMDVILERWNYRMPIYSNDKMNEHIKNIAHRVGIDKWKSLTTYAGRKSTATNWWNMDNIDGKVIQKIMGHERFETTQGYYADTLNSTVKRQTFEYVVQKSN